MARRNRGLFVCLFFRKDKWILGEQMRNKTFCDMFVHPVVRGLSVLLTAMNLPQRGCTGCLACALSRGRPPPTRNAMRLPQAADSTPRREAVRRLFCRPLDSQMSSHQLWGSSHTWLNLGPIQLMGMWSRRTSGDRRCAKHRA